MALLVGLVAAGGGAVPAGSGLSRSTVVTLTQSFTAVADSHVKRNMPKANFGRSSKLKTSASPIERAYLRFNVQGLVGTVAKATLRVHPTTSSPIGYDVRFVPGTGWLENAITYRNAPPAAGVTAASGSLKRGRWASVDVTPLVRGNGLISLALTTKRTSEISSDSREAGASVSPRLVVQTTTLPPQNTAAPTISGAALDGQTLAADPGGWSGTDPISYTYQWQRCDASGDACSPVSGATGPTYTVGTMDVSTTLRISVTGSNVAGTTTTTSAPTPVVAANPPPDVPPAPSDPVIAAAGDIACDPGAVVAPSDISVECHQQATSDLLVGQSLAAVLSLGDDQYDCGGYQAFLRSYDPSWGRVKAITHPVPGNHEYQASGGTDCDPTGNAGGYFQYFGAAAGQSGRGYYSFDVGSWHLVALNSNCGAVGGCGAGSAEETWLRQDLAAHPSACTLAFWHHPRFTSGVVGDDAEVADFWRDLSTAGVDVVLNGHAHGYERFAPQDPSATFDPSAGIREFVVGTGGEDFQAFSSTKPLSQVRDDVTFGVLMLTLHQGSYDWTFLPEAGQTFGDSGSGVCH
ncbi:MAG: DNRLRE domain-containing protein [Actinomycetota bacterium]|nr:DNRLRE domain-containing protein [Actinomycetota bacterium]